MRATGRYIEFWANRARERSEVEPIARPESVRASEIWQSPKPAQGGGDAQRARHLLSVAATYQDWCRQAIARANDTTVEKIWAAVDMLRYLVRAFRLSAICSLPRGCGTRLASRRFAGALLAF
jgi:hypothetical protein